MESPRSPCLSSALRSQEGEWQSSPGAGVGKGAKIETTQWHEKSSGTRYLFQAFELHAGSGCRRTVDGWSERQFLAALREVILGPQSDFHRSKLAGFCGACAALGPRSVSLEHAVSTLSISLYLSHTRSPYISTPRLPHVPSMLLSTYLYRMPAIAIHWRCHFEMLSARRQVGDFPPSGDEKQAFGCGSGRERAI